MSRSGIVGATNYREQPLSEIESDLANWSNSLLEVTEFVRKEVETLSADNILDGYALEFNSLLIRSTKFWSTCNSEILEILADFRVLGVAKHHSKRLNSLGMTAESYNNQYPRLWAECYPYLQTELRWNFERLYSEARGMMADLIDLQNAAHRLLDFVGVLPRPHRETEETIMHKHHSPRVIGRAKEIVLEAYNQPGKQFTISGGTLSYDEDVAATDREAAQYCYERNWARMGSSEQILILTASGVDFAKTLIRDSRERAVEAAMYSILDKAEEGQGQIVWFPDRKTIGGITHEFSEDSEKLSIFNDAAYRLVNDFHWLEKTQDAWHRITLEGRKALSTRNDYVEKIEENHNMSSVDMKKVFIVHGRDEKARLEVENFLRRLKLTPVVLFEENNRGRTIIEKFEQEAQTVAFAIVLLTPDDVGGIKDDKTNHVLKERARQNVVFELGYFFATLKRRNVVALLKGDIEHPSDFHGILYEVMDDSGGWKKEVAKEMREAGLPVDLNDL